MGVTYKSFPVCFSAVSFHTWFSFSQLLAHQQIIKIGHVLKRFQVNLFTKSILHITSKYPLLTTHYSHHFHCDFLVICFCPKAECYAASLHTLLCLERTVPQAVGHLRLDWMFLLENVSTSVLGGN